MNKKDRAAEKNNMKEMRYSKTEEWNNKKTMRMSLEHRGSILQEQKHYRNNETSLVLDVLI